MLNTPSLLKLAALASIAGLAACDAPANTATKPTPLVEVVTVTHQLRTLSQTLTGSVEAKAQASAAFLISGRLSTLTVDVGQRVQAGQVLARMSPAEYQADVDAAQAGVTAAQSRLAQTKTALDRQTSLWDQGLTTRSALDGAKTAWETASGTAESAQAQLELAQEALSYTTLKARADGVVIRKLANVDEVVQAGAPVFLIAEDGPRNARINVQEAAISGWDMNQQVSVSPISNPAAITTGRIAEIAPALDATGTVPVKVEVDPSLPLGVPVSVRLQVRQDDHVTLPMQALTLADGQVAVWLVSADNTVSLRAVAVERYESGVAILADGLEDNEKVVVSGGQFLSPGLVVDTREVAQP
ncbi:MULTISPECIES: efflux RND transporter periplasmic adaptor subunit [unclassified Devosia]|uniref:efflux RND transporter periplasmic adaptor subunit n=1 Tax=unclassified Devosia TaxID=196773 RepID=UPI00145EB7A3|nr:MULTISPECIES: efflux RND transporter periplasmic adaptor subunit [unclassified Devosia]MBJ6986795.1 efflux RND transporter periplasmic adaptor subunit [Devosia sp. MC521]QMW63830.1 efflux RND transporter periplasmic adaptor subunit [Devosia sp. MC521]